MFSNEIERIRLRVEDAIADGITEKKRRKLYEVMGMARYNAIRQMDALAMQEVDNLRVQLEALAPKDEIEQPANGAGNGQGKRKYAATLRKHQAMWREIRDMANQGKTPEYIAANLKVRAATRATQGKQTYSADTIREIIKEGDAGELD